MRTDELDYDLPAELIAQRPLRARSRSRLLVLHRSTGQLIDTRFDHIAGFLNAGDCLVLNNAKVLPARFFAARKTGAKLEGLFVKQLQAGVWQVMIKGARKLKAGEEILLKDTTGAEYCTARMAGRFEDGACRLEFDSRTDYRRMLEDIGFASLPPYIKRTDDAAQAKDDLSRYQTVYARKSGSVAAPTAGFHFTRKLLDELAARGIAVAYVTLHVGAGTFTPIKTDLVEKHAMHSEDFSVDADAARLINQTKQQHGRVVTVGTTSTRVLEAAAQNKHVTETTGSTNLFITPGYEFKVVDAMVTNFHLPRSTLLALVTAFAGRDNIRKAYRHAVEHRYRFYSFGDAMLII